MSRSAGRAWRREGCLPGHRRAGPRRPSRPPVRARASAGARRAARGPRTPCSAAYHGGAVGQRPVADERRGRRPRRSARAPRGKRSRRRSEQVGDRPVRDEEPQPVAPDERLLGGAQRLALVAREARAAGAGPAARRGRSRGRRAPGSRMRTRARERARDRRWASGRSRRRRTSAGSTTADVAQPASGARPRDSASGAAAAAAVTTGGGRRRRRRTSGAAAPSTTAPHAAARMALGPRIDARRGYRRRRTPGRVGAWGACCTKARCPTLHEGDEFAGHRILGIAGRGGMGVVYRALQLDLDRPVALKLIAPQLAEDPDVPRALRARVARRRRRSTTRTSSRSTTRARATTARCTSRCATSRARTCARSCAPRRAWSPARAAHDRRPGRRARSTPRTRAGSSTATSSRPTSCSAPTTTPT